MTAVTRCRGCCAPLPAPFLDLGALPLANALVDPTHADVPDSLHPLAVCRCTACQLVQLTDEVPPADLFSEYTYFSSFSDSFVEHARRLADELCERFSLGPHSTVLEVASNDGYFLQHLRHRAVRVLGVEPAANVAEAARTRGVNTLARFFGPEVVDEVQATLGPADVVVGNNVLAHVPAINDFLRAVRACLKPSGWAVFEFPWLLELLRRGEFDTIYHEHVFYYSLQAVDALLRRADLHLADASLQPVHGGSLRVFAARERQARSAGVESLLRLEQEAAMDTADPYRRFGQAAGELRDRLRERLSELTGRGLSLGAYGAPAKGNILLNYCGVGRDVVRFTVDRNPVKQGRLLPGSRIPVLAPEELVRRRPDVALLLPWNIADEIIAQQQDYLRAGGRFLMPVPGLPEVTA
jgi:SAM-dependent methyltransferase